MTNFTSIGQMVDDCHRRNAHNWVKAVDRWYFVVPAFRDEPAHIDYREGHSGRQMRAQADGTALPEWQPEPGEMEWIRAATARYLSDLVIPAGEEPEVTRAQFSRQMNHWSASKPWRAREDAA